MNDVFSGRRFRILMVKTILERPLQWSGILLVSFSAVFLIYFFFRITNLQFAQYASFAMGLIGGGCMLASMLFGHFSDKARGASFLTLPASSFEKWLCAASLVILYVVLFLAWFRIVDIIFINQYHHGLNQNDPRYDNLYNSVYLFSFTSDDAGNYFIFFINATAAMFVGTLYFNKIPFIKTALFVCGLIFFVFLLNNLISAALFKNVVNDFPFHHVAVRNGDDWGLVVMPPRFYPLFEWTLMLILPAILLIVSYIRLKEKET